jgi:putative nucleotidyltransferase with HDIG domain
MPEDIFPHIAKIPHLARIRELALRYDSRCWLTGGFLRDCVRGAAFAKYDFDFTFSDDVEQIARDFAKAIGGTAVLLDKEKRSVRVTKKRRGGILDYDFNAMRAPTIEDDLRMRDITVNALGVDIMSRQKVLIDVSASCDDISNRVIRVISRENITDDPLRIFRAFRFMAQLAATLDSATRTYIAEHASLLTQSAGERIADEFFKICAFPQAHRIVLEMDDTGVLDVIFPELVAMRGMEQGDYHHLDVRAHSVDTVRSFEGLCAQHVRDHAVLDVYLAEEIGQGRTRYQLLKLALLLHDVGKPATRAHGEKRTTFYEHDRVGSEMAGEICGRLKMSGKEKEFVQKMVAMHMRPGTLADMEQPTPHALYRFFRDSKGDGAGVVLTGLSDWRSTCGPGIDASRRVRHETIMLKLIDDYFAHLAKTPSLPILSGHDLLAMGFVPGPIIGQIMEDLAQRRALGEIHTKQEARKIVRSVYDPKRR